LDGHSFLIVPEDKPRIQVNEVSQSQAEYTTMALRTAPGAKVIGSTTAGADGDVSQIPLPALREILGRAVTADEVAKMVKPPP
jgi:C-terminal processing protease CtpA/Prc